MNPGRFTGLRVAPAQPQTTGGFTLIELLVALSIFALVSAIAYSGLESVLTSHAAVEKQAKRLAELQTALTILETDFEQAAPRGIRNQFGDSEPAMIADVTGLRFTRAGHRNPLGLPRSDLERVGYALGGDDDHELVRYTWPALDQPIEAVPDKNPILTDVDDVSFRFLTSDNQWVETWPPPVASGEPPALPVAVVVRLDLHDYGRIQRVFRMPTGSVNLQRAPGAQR